MRNRIRGPHKRLLRGSGLRKCCKLHIVKFTTVIANVVHTNRIGSLSILIHVHGGHFPSQRTPSSHVPLFSVSPHVHDLGACLPSRNSSSYRHADCRCNDPVLPSSSPPLWFLLVTHPPTECACSTSATHGHLPRCQCPSDGIRETPAPGQTTN